MRDVPLSTCEREFLLEGIAEKRVRIFGCIVFANELLRNLCPWRSNTLKFLSVQLASNPSPQMLLAYAKITLFRLTSRVTTDPPPFPDVVPPSLFVATNAKTWLRVECLQLGSAVLFCFRDSTVAKPSTLDKSKSHSASTEDAAMFRWETQGTVPLFASRSESCVIRSLSVSFCVEIVCDHQMPSPLLLPTESWPKCPAKSRSPNRPGPRKGCCSFTWNFPQWQHHTSSQEGNGALHVPNIAMSLSKSGYVQVRQLCFD